MGRLAACCVLAAAATASASPDDDAPSPDPEPSLADGELLDDPVAWQYRFGYEAASLQLDRVGLSGVAEGPRTWAIRYRSDGIPARIVTHGFVIQPNLVYQPSTVPLQLVAGIQVGVGFAAPPDYATVDGDVLARPQEGQALVALRAGLPLGLRTVLGPLALRGQMVPGFTLVSVDELVVSPEGAADGTSMGVVESVRGQGGVDLRLSDELFFGMPFGLTFDAGYDFGRLRGWNVVAGLALLGEPSSGERE